MHNFFKRIFPIFAIIAACFACFFAGAAVQRAKPTPDAWVSRYGTNFLTINQDAALGAIVGSTTYTGATTNIALTNLYRIQIVNGIVTGVVGL